MVAGRWRIFFAGQETGARDAFDQAKLERAAGKKIIARIREAKQGNEFSIFSIDTFERKYKEE